MKKQFIYALLCGAMILSTGTFTSCNDDDVDDLKSRLTVVEVAIADLKEQLGKALTVGASVIKATQDDQGVWTLQLSDGTIIKIAPSSGSSNISVTESEASITITIDGKNYVLPKSSAVNSLVYSPEYVDGIVQVGDNGKFVVKFLATPAPTAENLAKATFKIATHELKTRVDYSLFEVVEDEVSLEDGFLKVTIQALDDVVPGAKYAGAVVMELGGTSVSSNYFTMSISDNLSVGGEDLITPTFAASVTDAQEIATGFWAATLPESVDFLGTFDFSSLITNLPAGAKFALGKSADQNDAVNGRYDFFKTCLASNGTWEMKGRPGTNGAGEAGKPGILIVVKEGTVTKAKIYWKVIDPLADIDFKRNLAGLGQQHLEYGTNGGDPTIMEPGANKINLTKMFLAGEFSIMHDQGKTVEAFKAYTLEIDGESAIYVSGNQLVVADDLKKYAKFSKGIEWYNRQASIAASQRQNWAMTDEEKKAIAKSECNGEIIGGYDGLSGENMNKYGMKITADGFYETTDVFGGWATRVGIGLRFEYDYGTKDISDESLAYVWFNRRWCAEGVVDLEKQ